MSRKPLGRRIIRVFEGLVQAALYLQLRFEKSLNLQQLRHITLTLHAWHVHFNISEHIGDTACIQRTEIQIEGEIRFLCHTLTAP